MNIRVKTWGRTLDTTTVKGKISHILLDSGMHSSKLLLAFSAMLVGATMLMLPVRVAVGSEAVSTLYLVALPVLFGLQGLMSLCMVLHHRAYRWFGLSTYVLGCFLWTSAAWPGALMQYLTGCGTQILPPDIGIHVMLVLFSWWHMVRYWADNGTNC